MEAYALRSDAMLALDYRPSKRLRAALTLAAVYAAGVTLLLVTLISEADSPRRVLDTLPLFSIPAGICFAVAFLLLAVARRAGFTALWVVVFSFWAWATTQDASPFAASSEFVAWSLFAAPLYAMCALGFRHETPRAAGWRQWMSIALWPVWTGLVVMALRQVQLVDSYYPLHWPYMGWLGRSLLTAWLVTPPAVTLAGIHRVYSRAPVDSSGSAA